MTSSEEWRPVLGHEGRYEVSDLGRVRSLPAYIQFKDGRGRRVFGKMLTPNATGGPYLRVAVGMANPIHIHRLVMDAFMGPKPDGMEVRHVDGNPHNNALCNLTYGTSSENNHDIVRHGRHFQANKTHCPRDHPYDEQNTRIYQGRRFCLTCSRERSHRKKAA